MLILMPNSILRDSCLKGYRNAYASNYALKGTLDFLESIKDARL